MLSLDAGVIYRIPALLIALTVHEYAHGMVSDSLGDPTPRMQGRLTLNPLAHLDILGTFMLLVAGFGWAKPVMIDPRYYKDIRSGTMKVAFAGPGSNLFVCFLALFFMNLLGHFNLVGNNSMVVLFLRWLMLYNVWFAFFNLIPLPPLDGSKILSSFLSPRQNYEYGKIAPYSFYILIALVFTGLTNIFIMPLAQGYVSIIQMILGIIF